MTKLDKIKKFISDNGLDFTGSGSELNSNCVVLAGYACYIEIDEPELTTYVEELDDDVFSWDAVDEFKRVYEYADNNNYGEFWDDPDAHSEYIFEDK